MKRLGAWVAKAAKAIGAVAIGVLVFGVSLLLKKRGGNGQETYQLYEVRTRKGRRGSNIGNALLNVFDAFQPSGGAVDQPRPIPVSATSAPAPAPPRGGGSSVGIRLRGDLERTFGLTRQQAAGIVGNLAHESANFTIMQEIRPTVPGSRGGYGYAQWTGPRRRDFEKWAAGNGLDLASYAANWGFLKHELTQTWEKRVIPQVKRTRTVEDATQIFSSKFLRPGAVAMSSRIAYARKYL